MEFTTVRKDSFAVLGKEIYTWDGDGMIPRLWEAVEKKFSEIEGIVLRDGSGHPLGKWGAMSSKKRDFSMWEENGSVGLYLAGYEVPADAKAPKGWTLWTMPAFEFRLGKIEGEGYFYRALKALEEAGTPVVGATEMWFDPATGEPYFAFPVKRL